jgi:hypothetical protein
MDRSGDNRRRGRLTLIGYDLPLPAPPASVHASIVLSIQPTFLPAYLFSARIRVLVGYRYKVVGSAVATGAQ